MYVPTGTCDLVEVGDPARMSIGLIQIMDLIHPTTQIWLQVDVRERWNDQRHASKVSKEVIVV